jgi:flagellin
MNTHRNLTINNTATAKSLEKLSSGYRVNRAGDDAAGLAISEKMRGQIRGLNQAIRNSQDGISLIQTTEGALNETHSILQRMRELAVQAANDTNTDDDRNELQKEVKQLISEVDRIAFNTEFNTKKLLEGSLRDGAWREEELSVTSRTGDFEVLISGALSLHASGAIDGNPMTTGKINVNNTYTVRFEELDSSSGLYTYYVYNETANNGAVKVGSGTMDATTGATVTLTDGSSAFSGISSGQFTFSIVSGNATKINIGDSFTIVARQAQNENNTAYKGLQFQVGANSNQTINLGINSMMADALFITKVNISDAPGATMAISTIDNAVKWVSAERSKLGAVQNRIEHTIANLGVASENISAAESRIRDVDMAKEMMEYTKQNILAQAATAMLAQANQIPQQVLQLLQ